MKVRVVVIGDILIVRVVEQSVLAALPAVLVSENEKVTKDCRWV